MEYSPWGCKELDTTKHSTHTHIPHLLKPSSTDGHVGCYILETVNNAGMNIGVYVSFRIRVFIFYLDIYLEVGLLSHRVTSQFFREQSYCSL